MRRFCLLDPATQILVVEAFGLSAFIALTFRLVGVPQTQAWLRRWAEFFPARISREEYRSAVLRARRAQYMVKRATGLGGMCLARSLTLWTLLRRRGIETELRVGYRKRDAKIEGHAWLEYDGAPINDDNKVTRTYTVADGLSAFDNWRQMKA